MIMLFPAYKFSAAYSLLRGCCIIGLIVAQGSGLAHAQNAASHPLRKAVECTARDGLPHFFQKLKNGEPVTIVYFGGSITEQNGWRVLSQQWFEKQYPKAAITGVNAAIGGTDSELGVYRVEKDALAAKPDLLFVEFAVNDAYKSPETIIRGMEGIVRKTWKANPEADICFVYSTTYRDFPALAEGKMKRSASVMEAVADHYGIPSVHMGLEVARLEKEGKLIMKTDAPMQQVSGDSLDERAAMATDGGGRIIFSKDGVHPYRETGHVFYAEALARAMLEMSEEAWSSPHVIPEPMYEDNWERASLVPIPEAFVSGPAKRLPAGDLLAKRFTGRLSPLYRMDPGAELNFKFRGTKVALYDILGPDGAALEVTLDGDTKTIRRMDAFCTYHRLGFLRIGDDLEDATHEVTVRVLDEPFDKSNILFEHNRDDIQKSPERYADYCWYPGAVLILGEITE